MVSPVSESVEIQHGCIVVATFFSHFCSTHDSYGSLVSKNQLIEHQDMCTAFPPKEQPSSCTAPVLSAVSQYPHRKSPKAVLPPHLCRSQTHKKSLQTPERAVCLLLKPRHVHLGSCFHTPTEKQPTARSEPKAPAIVPSTPNNAPPTAAEDHMPTCLQPCDPWDQKTQPLTVEAYGFGQVPPFVLSHATREMSHASRGVGKPLQFASPAV